MLAEILAYTALGIIVLVTIWVGREEIVRIFIGKPAEAEFAGLRFPQLWPAFKLDDGKWAMYPEGRGRRIAITLTCIGVVPGLTPGPTGGGKYAEEIAKKKGFRRVDNGAVRYIAHVPAIEMSFVKPEEGTIRLATFLFDRVEYIISLVTENDADQERFGQKYDQFLKSIRLVSRVPEGSFDIFLSYTTRNRLAHRIVLMIEDALTRLGVGYFCFMNYSTDDTKDQRELIKRNIRNAVYAARLSLEIRTQIIDGQEWIQAERILIEDRRKTGDIRRVWSILETNYAPTESAATQAIHLDFSALAADDDLDKHRSIAFILARALRRAIKEDDWKEIDQLSKSPCTFWSLASE